MKNRSDSAVPAPKGLRHKAWGFSPRKDASEPTGSPVGAQADPKRNGLARLAGTWSEEEFKRFEAAVAITEQIQGNHGVEL
jgi:hypothetical protein